jgi:flotillin
MEIIAILLGVFGLGTGAGWFVIRNLYYICQPSEILIFAGTKSHAFDGKEVGYRLVKGGSSIRIPMLEEAFRMDLTNMIIELKVSNAYSKGGIPLTVEGVANIKIAGEEPTIHNAIERLLGKSRKQIEQLAKETLEGNLRGVLASLTPEQVNEDKIAFAKSLLEEAEDDLEKLGLVLDNLQIQNISDDVHYLNSKESENKKITSLRQIGRDLEIAKAEAEKRIRDAITKREALVAEAEAQVVAEIAKAEAEVAVQTERIKQVQQQLQADVVAPAEAQCKQAIAKAKGDAASIIEDGKAQAEGTQRLAESWKAAGDNAKEIFLFQKLETLMKMMAAGVPEVEVESVTVVNGKDGNSATKLAAFIEQLRQTTGIDAAQIAYNLSANNSIKKIETKIEPHKLD